MRLPDDVFDALDFDVIAIEEASSAYSRIRSTFPDFVLLCTSMNDPAPWQLLSMLKLDAMTRAIPVDTCVTGALDDVERPSAGSSFRPAA
jgi:hypothetical protein